MASSRILKPREGISHPNIGRRSNAGELNDDANGEFPTYSPFLCGLRKWGCSLAKIECIFHNPDGHPLPIGIPLLGNPLL